ncbi:MAG: zf-TFIIB domain-containing protein [Pyrinomonadaceae bacterium]
MRPESLKCPNCGAAVSTDLPNCAFCRSRLKTVGCPSCLGVMFLGSKFCTHCGHTVQPAELIDDDHPGDCPRCKRTLQTLRINSMTIRECERCGGFWSSIETFESLCADKEQQASVLGFIRSYSHPNSDPPKVTYVPCPDCKALMNRSNFARSSGVIIDLCKQHGVWFDAGELPKIINFIDSGGLERAREKEKIAIQDERSRLRDEQRRLAMMARRSGNASIDEEKPTIFGGLIARLFDL